MTKRKDCKNCAYSMACTYKDDQNEDCDRTFVSNKDFSIIQASQAQLQKIFNEFNYDFVLSINAGDDCPNVHFSYPSTMTVCMDRYKRFYFNKVSKIMILETEPREILLSDFVIYFSIAVAEYNTENKHPSLENIVKVLNESEKYYNKITTALKMKFDKEYETVKNNITNYYNNKLSMQMLNLMNKYNISTEKARRVADLIGLR